MNTPPQTKKACPEKQAFLGKILSLTFAIKPAGDHQGHQADLYGIEAPGVNRVSIDQLIIRQTGRAGLFLQGLGSTSFDNQITVTRCEVFEATTAAGIHLSATTQVACLS